MSQHSYECEAECIAMTADAILCVIDEEKHWIPKTQILEDSDVKEQGDEGTLLITQWIAEQKELV